jgi:hypothetical protein
VNTNKYQKGHTHSSFKLQKAQRQYDIRKRNGPVTLGTNWKRFLLKSTTNSIIVIGKQKTIMSEIREGFDFKDSTEFKTMTNDDSIVSESANVLNHSEEYREATGASEQPAEGPQNTIGKKETQEVYKFKIIVLIVLFLSAIVTATCVYVFISKKEEEQFHEQFQSYAAKVLDAVGNSIDQTLIPMDTLAVNLVSYAHATNSPWPFVSLPDFGLRLAKALPLTDATILTFAPIVRPEQKLDWEIYADQSKGWMNDSMHLLENWDGYYGSIGYNWTTNPVIYTDHGDLENNVRYVHFSSERLT